MKTIAKKMRCSLMLALAIGGLAGCAGQDQLGKALDTSALQKGGTFLGAIENDAERMKSLRAVSAPAKAPAPTPGVNAELTTYVQGLLDRFTAASLTPQMKISAVVASCEVFTDETEPAGHLRFCAETLRHLGSESEIAFIVAHEAAHGLLRHTMGDADRKTAQKEKMWNSSFFLGPNGFTAAGASAANEDAAIKRQQEREADLYGIDLMTRAGFNPNGAYSFFDLKRRSQLAKTSYHEQESERRGRMLDWAMEKQAQRPDSGLLGATILTNAIDSVIAAGVDDKDHDGAEARMSAVAAYVNAHYKDATARPVGALPWKAKPGAFSKTAKAFATP